MAVVVAVVVVTKGDGDTADRCCDTMLVAPYRTSGQALLLTPAGWRSMGLSLVTLTWTYLALASVLSMARLYL